MGTPAEGFVGCLVQCPDPRVGSRAELDGQVERIARTTLYTKARVPEMELIVFPEHSTHGSETATRLSDELLCDIPGPETDVYAKACRDGGTFGIFSVIERNPAAGGNPFDAAVLIDPTGEIVLHSRKLQPSPRSEPWSPGDLGVPVTDGPGASKIAIGIGSDGMFPELAREAAYQGANVYVRISGYARPSVRETDEQWLLNNRSNAWHNLMYTMAVNLADRYPGHITSYDGTVIAQGRGDLWEVVSGRLFPALADQARREGAQDNNLYNVGHRGYVAVPGGERDAGLQWVKDATADRGRRPADGLR